MGEDLQRRQLEEKIIKLERQLELEKEQTEQLRKEEEDLRTELNILMQLYHSVTSSHFWRLTKPLRRVVDGVKKVIMAFLPLRFAYKGTKILLTQGPGELLRRVMQKYKGRIPTNYMKITEETRRREESEVFDNPVTFSILVPLYNTPIQFLKEMIESVQAQTYPNWELCLADGSDTSHAEVGECVLRYQEGDSRIRYQKLEKNLGISENTNACISMSTGGYICLFDHDDLLHPSVLYENMKAIQETGADFLYTDEAVFVGTDITKITTFHFKPDFAIDNLRANNYICHFSTFSRELLQKSGLFRSAYDGSQDHDLILRLTHYAQHVHHIPKLLYFWRSHANSVAQNLGSKPYAIQAGVNSVHDNLCHFGLPCEVESIPASPTLYRIRYQLKEKPLVSIIISFSDDAAALEKCLRTILARTVYASYEIIVVITREIDRELKTKFAQYKKNFQVRFVFAKSGEQTDNYGASLAKGMHLIFLSECMEITSPKWIEEMLMYSQRDDVGAVSMLLYYPNQTIYHAGYILGIGKEHIAGVSHAKMPREYLGYMGRLLHSQDVSAVTKDCLMVKKAYFDAVGGFNPAYRAAFADLDFCLKLRQKNLLNVLTPYAEGYYTQPSRKRDLEKQRKAWREEDGQYFLAQWKDNEVIRKDPFYNPNFTKELDYQIDYSHINADRR